MPKEEITVLPDGRFQFKDLETGEVRIQAQAKHNLERIEQGKAPRPVSLEIPAKRFVYKQNKNKVRLLVPWDLSAKDLPDDYVHLKDDEEVQNDILLLLSEGWTLKRICALPEFPTYLVVFNLLMADEGFRKKVDLARRIQAEQQKDDFEELIDTIEDEDSAKVAKAKADLLKHLMSVNDKDRFGAQTKIALDAAMPLSISFNTGIVRDVDRPIPAIAERVPDESEHGSGLLEQGSEVKEVLGVAGDEALEGVRRDQPESAEVESPSPGLDPDQGTDT